MINIKLYKWFETLNFDYKKYIIEILKCLLINRFVSDNDLFKIPKMKLKFIDKAWRNDLIIKYWSLSNKKIFYSIGIDGHYILNKLGYNTDLMLNSTLEEFQQIYNQSHREQLNLNDLVVVKPFDILLNYQIREHLPSHMTDNIF